MQPTGLAGETPYARCDGRVLVGPGQFAVSHWTMVSVAAIGSVSTIISLVVMNFAHRTRVSVSIIVGGVAKQW